MSKLRTCDKQCFCAAAFNGVEMQPADRVQQNSRDNHQALVAALKRAASENVVLRLRTADGWTHRVVAPIIVGNDFVQFAVATSRRSVIVQFDRVSSFDFVEMVTPRED